MKFIYLIIIALMFSNCKDENKHMPIEEHLEVHTIQNTLSDSIQMVDKDIEPAKKAIAIELKQQKLIEKSDEREAFQSLIINKNYKVNKDGYTINFKYPLLNESINPKYSNFNEFINDYYVNIAQTESEILEAKTVCDSIESLTFREERFIDYKIYIANDQLVSVLFYKENYYSGAIHSSFAFDGFNFDLNKGAFMVYEDFFIQGSEDELLQIINAHIKAKAQQGELYYDCWELELDDFSEGKNNFVLNDTNVEFYFDDCVMCPSYTGSYSIILPLIELQPVLKKYDTNPFMM